MKEFSIYILALCLILGCAKSDTTNLIKQGELKLREGKQSDAYQLFKKASRLNPTSGISHWLAAQSAPDQNSGFVHTKAAWENGMKTAEVLMALTQLSFHSNSSQKLKYALGLYEQLPDSVRSPLLKSDIFFNFGVFDSSLSILKTLSQTETNGGINKAIAIVYDKTGAYHQADSVLTFSLDKNILDPDGFLLLATLALREYDYEKIDSIFELGNIRYPNDSWFKLKQTEFYISGQNFNKAQTVLSSLKNSEDTLIVIKSIENLVLLHLLTADQMSLKALSESHSLYARYFEKSLNYLSNKYDLFTSKQTDSLANIDPVNSASMLIIARLNSKNSDYKKAIIAYQTLPQAILYSPQLLPEYCNALTNNGEDEKALTYLSTMHSKKIFTKSSLEIFRDITFKKELLGKSIAAQQMLESHFGEDASVKWSWALMAAKRGQLDSALLKCEELIKLYPKEERFITFKLTLLMAKNRPREVLDMVDKTSLARESKALFKARAFARLKDFNNANRWYDTIFTYENSPSIAMEYADILVKSGNSAKASTIYQNLLNEKNGFLPEQKALLLNNLAWTLLQNDTTGYSTALETAQQAIKILPEKIQIIDTYCYALIKNKKYKECIRYLTTKSNTLSPVLKYRLATAYEGQGELNKAIRLYTDVLGNLKQGSNKSEFTSLVELSEKIAYLKTK